MNIVVIGAGNIATHYAKAFDTLGHKIIQVYNRTSANAKVLADVLYSAYIDNINQIDLHADLYLIAIKDEYIQSLADLLPESLSGVVVHCSGATSMEVLNRFHRYGVIYPVQSINKAIDTDLQKTPFAIEGSDAQTLNLLIELMQQISTNCFACNTQQRLALHVAAVFANNFTNKLYDIAESILKKENLSLDLLKPIILETAKKIENHAPNTVQTGPAIRNDQKTINSHLDFLNYSDELSQIYQSMTDYIANSGGIQNENYKTDKNKKH